VRALFFLFVVVLNEVVVTKKKKKKKKKYIYTYVCIQSRLNHVTSTGT
jgi:hypothetical protein